MLSVLSSSCHRSTIASWWGTRRNRLRVSLRSPQPRCRRPLQPPDPMAADDDGADDHAYSGHTLAATVMSTVSYISHDAGACLKSHISYIATYACTIAMPASVPTRVRSAIPFACFRAVCRVSCMDFAAGDGPLGTL